MKKTTTRQIEVARIAKRDTRCDAMEQALLAKPDTAGRPAKHWPTAFQASGSKSGSKAG